MDSPVLKAVKKVLCCIGLAVLAVLPGIVMICVLAWVTGRDGGDWEVGFGT